MDEPAVFGTNEDHPFYFDDLDRPARILPLKCPLYGSAAKYDNPPYETWNTYHYNYAEAVFFTDLLFSKTPLVIICNNSFE